MTALLQAPAPRRAAPAPAPPTTRRQRARTAILLSIATVIAAHVWLASRVESDRPEWREPEFFHRVNAARALKRTDARPLVAILGGSRPQMGLDPAALPANAVNFSQSGCLPVGIWLNFTRLLDAGLDPRFALIEVLPPVLADGAPAEERLHPERLSEAELENLAPFIQDADGAKSRWRAARMRCMFDLRSPLRANLGLAEDRGEPERLWTHMTPRGWSPAPHRPTSEAERERRLAVAHRTYAWLLGDFDIHTMNDRAYRMILNACRERGIRSVLFTMPESPRFRSWYPPAARAKFQTWFATLAAEYGIPAIDASAWFDEEAAFLDGHHLTRAAAERFSERFGREWAAVPP